MNINGGESMEYNYYEGLSYSDACEIIELELACEQECYTKSDSERENIRRIYGEKINCIRERYEE